MLKHEEESMALALLWEAWPIYRIIVPFLFLFSHNNIFLWGNNFNNLRIRKYARMKPAKCKVFIFQIHWTFLLYGYSAMQDIYELQTSAGFVIIFDSRIKSKYTACCTGQWLVVVCLLARYLLPNLDNFLVKHL